MQRTRVAGSTHPRFSRGDARPLHEAHHLLDPLHSKEEVQGGTGGEQARG